MKITKDEVIHVTELARLNLDKSAIDKFAVQIGKILEYVETLNQIDTSDVIPTAHVILLTNAFRDDVEKEHIGKDAALSNAPEKENGHFLVPKVVG